MRYIPAHSLVVVLLVFSLAVGVATTYSSLGRTGHAASSTALVIRRFGATVHQGPDTGLSLNGTLTLHYDRTGALTGRFAPPHGQATLVSGQLTGQAINLVFYLGHGQHIFGVGTFGQDPGARGEFVGGPLVGPKKADAGDWGGSADDDLGSGNVAHGTQFGD